MRNNREKEILPLPPRRFSSHMHTHTRTREVMRNPRPGSAPSMTVSHRTSDHDDLALSVKEYTDGEISMCDCVSV